jgi:signal peptidase I
MRTFALVGSRWAHRLISLLWLSAMAALVGLAAWSHVAGLLVVGGKPTSPALPPRSLIQPGDVDPEAIRVGDVVTVKGDNGVLVTHRVVRIAELPAGPHLELRGDANPAPDPVLVPADAVQGRVDLVVPLAGFVVAMLATLPGLLSIASLLAAMLVATWILEDIEMTIATRDGETQAAVGAERRAAG